MNKIDCTLTRLAAALLVGMAALPAHATGTGETLLNVTNFRLLHTNGSQYLARDVTNLSNNNIASVPGITQYYPAGDANFATCSLQYGFSCNPIYTNYFEPYREDGYHFRNYYTYVNGALRQEGSLFPDQAGSLTINTRGDIGYSGGTTSGSFNGFGTVILESTFQPVAAGAVTFSFDAQPYAIARQSFTRGGPLTANVGFSLTLRDLTAGTTIFEFAPLALNFTLSSNDGGLRLADPELMHFSATTDVLDPGSQYLLRLEQHTASVATLIAVPEPATHAMLLAGLGVLVAMRARRRT